MEERIDTKEEFSLIKRAKSFTHAGRGIWLFVKTTHNAWVHIVFCSCSNVGDIFPDFGHRVDATGLGRRICVDC
jgi:hypothetical protein